jgi:hypothetical protein
VPGTAFPKRTENFARGRARVHGHYWPTALCADNIARFEFWHKSPHRRSAGPTSHSVADLVAAITGAFYKSLTRPSIPCAAQRPTRTSKLAAKRIGDAARAPPTIFALARYNAAIFVAVNHDRRGRSYLSQTELATLLDRGTMPEKLAGTTRSERYLAHLCKGTFLSLWSYPNVFRDQGRQSDSADGKELCDLLVVCGDDVIIFSDKSCAFGNSGDLKTDWRRWYKKAIKKSADQLFGAHRWIREFPTKLFQDRGCKVPFPIDLSHVAQCRFHLVVVATGAKDRCRECLGGSGSLVICPEILADRHVDADCEPFYVGLVDSTKQYVHVFDDVTLDIILNELDTVTDLVDYLRCKEDFIRTGKLKVALGEENLLSYFVSKMGPGGHCIPLPDGKEQLVVQDGVWRNHIHSPEYNRKNRANKTSYAWDQLIEVFAASTINNAALATNTTSIAQAELGLRTMAKERRVNRRVLSDAWIAKLRSAAGNHDSVRTVLSYDNPSTAYVFLACPETKRIGKNYREYRLWFLNQYCFVVAWKRKLRRVVGIATEPGVNNAGRSYDLVVYAPESWTEEMQQEAEQVQKQLNILDDKNLEYKHYHDDEYPKAGSSNARAQSPSQAVRRPHFSDPRRVGRNDSCPCGSGLKFKKCCLRRSRIR